jgi:hypothetical protein
MDVMIHLRYLAAPSRPIVTAKGKQSGGRDVKHLTTLAIVLGVTLGLSAGARAADEANKPEAAAEAPPKCLEAAVNPVTGFAVCVNPTGAPVEQPPRSSFNRPCKPRAHDNEDWTVYEHASGC